MIMIVFVFFCKQKTAYEMRISDWSSDVCSSDLDPHDRESRSHVSGQSTVDEACARDDPRGYCRKRSAQNRSRIYPCPERGFRSLRPIRTAFFFCSLLRAGARRGPDHSHRRASGTKSIQRIGTTGSHRSEEHTSELQSLMRLTY